MKRYRLILYLGIIVSLFTSGIVSAQGLVINNITGLSDTLTVKQDNNIFELGFVIDAVGGYSAIELSILVIPAGGVLYDAILQQSIYLGSSAALANAPDQTAIKIALSQPLAPGERLVVYVQANYYYNALWIIEFPEDSNDVETAIAPNCNSIDGRLDANCGANIAVFADQHDDTCYIRLYSAYGNENGEASLVLALPDVPARPEKPSENILLASSPHPVLGEIAAYLLTTGEFQINVGIYDSQVYVLNFTGCSGENAYTSNSYRVTP